MKDLSLEDLRLIAIANNIQTIGRNGKELCQKDLAKKLEIVLEMKRLKGTTLNLYNHLK